MSFERHDGHLYKVFLVLAKGARPNIGREPDHGKRTRLIFRLIGIGTDQ